LMQHYPLPLHLLPPNHQPEQLPRRRRQGWRERGRRGTHANGKVRRPPPLSVVGPFSSLSRRRAASSRHTLAPSLPPAVAAGSDARSCCAGRDPVLASPRLPPSQGCKSRMMTQIEDDRSAIRLRRRQRGTTFGHRRGTFSPLDYRHLSSSHSSLPKKPTCARVGAHTVASSMRLWWRCTLPLGENVMAG
jgi:hypothetical protein